MKKRTIFTVLLASGSIALLSACGTTASGDSAAGQSTSTMAVSPVNTTPVIPADVVVSEAEAPEGFTYGDVGAILEDSGPEGDTAEVLGVLTGITEDMITEPAQCAPLVPTAAELLIRMAEDPEHNAATEYASADGNTVISVYVTTGDANRAPEEVTECTTITRTIGMEDFEETLTYEATPRAAAVEGTDTVTSAHVASTDSAFESAAVDAVMIAGTVGDVYFHINADGPVGEQTIDQLARAQVDKIHNR